MAPRGRAPGPAAYDGRVRHYLDHAATSPLRPAAREAWLEASQRVGNPSSLHASGRSARGLAEDARERLAAALGAHPTEVIFTSGGTEADNLAILGGFFKRRAADPALTAVVTSAVEHHAALDPARWLAREQGAETLELPVDAHARVEVDALRDALAERAERTALVSVQWVNNEVGTVQPLAEVVEVAASRGIPVHADAVQGIGHLPFDFAASGLATAAASAHKVGGPVGVGVLLARRDAQLAPVSHGGGQERRLRSGTVDAAGAWAFAVALDDALAAREAEAERMSGLVHRLGEAIKGAASGATVHGGGPGQAPHILHAIIPGAPGESLLTALDLAGIDASPGAACTAGVIEPSHVVEAMGYGPVLASQTLRLSVGWSTTEADVDAAVVALPAAIERATAAGRT